MCVQRPWLDGGRRYLFFLISVSTVHSEKPDLARTPPLGEDNSLNVRVWSSGRLRRLSQHPTMPSLPRPSDAMAAHRLQYHPRPCRRDLGPAATSSHASATDSVSDWALRRQGSVSMCGVRGLGWVGGGDDGHGVAGRGSLLRRANGRRETMQGPLYSLSDIAFALCALD